MADLVIERCLPSDRAADILGIFDRAGRPEFATVFERSYRVRERRGLRSWIGSTGDRTVLHISLALDSYSDGERTLMVGIPGDLMADESQRDFWGPIKLVRRMVADVRAERTVDFLLTSFTPAAEGIFRAAGFKKFGTLARHVMPLISPYPLLRRLLHGEERPRLTAVPFDDPLLESFLPSLRSPGCFRPVATRDFYVTRMPRIEYPAGTWLLAGTPQSPESAVLVAPRDNRTLVVADVLWRGEAPRLAGLFSSVARWAAQHGHRLLLLTTMEHSRLSSAARRAGFLLRADPFTVMTLPVANESIPSPEQWSFTPFSLTGW